MRLLQDRVAEVAVGPSALRNKESWGRQANPSVSKVRSDRPVLHDHRGRISTTPGPGHSRLEGFSPSQSEALGYCSKGSHLFLRDCLYHSYLSRQSKLARIGSWLEIPLDSQAAAGVVASTKSGLPLWPGIKHLTPDVSRLYQDAARRIAARKGTYRIHLDLEWWRPRRAGEAQAPGIRRSVRPQLSEAWGQVCEFVRIRKVPGAPSARALQRDHMITDLTPEPPRHAAPRPHRFTIGIPRWPCSDRRAGRLRAPTSS